MTIDENKKKYIKTLIKNDLKYIKVNDVDIYINWFGWYNGYNAEDIKEVVYDVFKDFYEERNL